MNQLRNAEFGVSNKNFTGDADEPLISQGGKSECKMLIMTHWDLLHGGVLFPD